MGVYWQYLLVLADVLGSVRCTQFPFRIPAATAEDDWDLNRTPNPNTTGHLIFDTVHSFLQHWPNTRYRNGHNIVPGVVPVGTLLYHGRSDDQIPTEPQWTATDPEHSYSFCRGSVEEGCWQLTLSATRPLNVLYFDGSAAAKLADGPLQTQDIVAWGEIRPDMIREEYTRIDALCTWGRKFGVDGFVRMEMDFEIMICDFTAGLEVVSFSHLTSNKPAFPGPRWPGRKPTYITDYPVATSDRSVEAFEVLHSGSWHNLYPGDTRIRLDLARFVSFYDTALVPSLMAQRLGQERFEHHLGAISQEDITAVMERVERVVETPHRAGCGVDWSTLLHTIFERYQNRLEMIQYLLNSSRADASDNVAKKVQTQLDVMVQPYNLHSVTVPTEAYSRDLSWSLPIYKLCATTHTKHLHSSQTFLALMTESEHLLLGAIDETNREICRVVTRMWAEGAKTAGAVEDDALLGSWRVQLTALMDWLDWSAWIKCDPACGVEEMCYLPTWPFFGRTPPRFPGGGAPEFPGGPGGPGHWPHHPGGHGKHFTDGGADDGWERPQPKCIRRVEPYSF
ncbi:hypothetical protein BDZ89DRAFT_967608 [Hymenopellis radicata]|nr:hypothetical protein BDZ89DRAFT_967608 [Hymenopellis radicata]